MFRVLLSSILSVSAVSFAATTAQPLTPLNTSVLGGDRQVYSVRFYDALGRPSVGESVHFSNDACGFFDNGGFSTTVLTDMTGTASVNFTARAQGITCWVVAQAGVSVRFNVFTYTMGQVSLSGAPSPVEPRPGQPFAFTARAYAGAYPIYNADITARAIPSDAASIVTVTSAGSETTRDFLVTPNALGGTFEVELGFRGVRKLFVIAGSDAPFQDMWWGGSSENGWGVSVVQHDDRLFAAIYTYDAAGAPTWYVMPAGSWNAARTAFTGALYSPRGSPYSSYDASKLQVGAAVGTATLAFAGASEGSLAYVIDGVAGTKSITRQLFGPPENTAAPVTAGDMWWGGGAQNGWGIALLQQYRTLFGVWFTYDASGAPTWFVMPSGFWADNATWQGRLYRARGSPWLGRPYDAGLVASTDVGSYSFRFDGSNATFTYTIDGKPGTMAVVRQPF